MKLIILIDVGKPKIALKEDDIVLTDDFYYKKNCEKIIWTEFFEDGLDIDEYKLFWDKTGLEVYENKFYINHFSKIMTIIKKVDSILDNNEIDTIVLFGGNKHTFLSYFYGEGEGIKKKYSTSWLVNFAVYNNYKEKYKIEWHHKSFIASRFFNLIRERILYAIYVFKQTTKSIISKKTTSISSLSQNVAFYTLKLQYNHIKFIESLRKDNFLKLHFSDCDKNNNEGVLERLSFRETLQVIKMTRNRQKELLKNNHQKMLSVGFAMFDAKVFFAFFNPIIFRYFYMVSTLNKNLLNSNIKPTLFLTDMVYSIDLEAIHAFCTKNNIKHINYQYVSMAKINLPYYKLADSYYLSVLPVYKFYKKKSDIFRLYLPFEECPKPFSLKKNFVVTVFLQPDSFTDVYLSIVKKMSELFANYNNYSFNIKPHYRQDKTNKFEEIVKHTNNFKMTDANKNVRNLIKESDLIISVCSSVLIETVMCGKMGIILNYNNIVKDYSHFYPEINFVCKSIEEIKTILDSYQHYYDIFVTNYHSYIKQIGFDECGDYNE